MRLISYEGKDIKLSENDWKQLLKRFDPCRANLNYYGYYCINAPALCRRYRYKCFVCPLGAVTDGTNRCTYLFDSIMGEELSRYVYLFDPVVVWSPDYDAEARLAIQRIKDVLSAA